jgi:nucleotide sugar dehydrogenase
MTLKANPETLKGKNSEDEKTTVSIVECNRVGILHACLLTEANFKVTCVDNDRAVVERLSKGKAQFLKQEIEPILKKSLENGRLQVTYNLGDAVSQSNVVLVTTPATINESGRIDYSSIEKTLKKLGSHIQKDTLIILTSVIGIGVTESLKETLESSSGFRVGVDFYLAYSPVPFPEKQTISSLTKFRRIVAAFDDVSLEKALKVIGAITKEAVATLSIKTAEAAVLFNTAYRSVGSALANEFARLCEKTGVDYLSVQNMQPLSWETLYQPALNNFGENPLLMLLEEAENHNVKLRILQTVLDSSDENVKHGISLIQEALKTCGKAVRKAKIAVLGVSQTRNITDKPKGVLKTFVKILERKGAKLSFYDPYLYRKASAERRIFEESLMKAVEGADCIVVFTGHDQFKRLNLGKIKLLVKMPAAIVDFEGIFDPYKVEGEGFVYRGLGRGVWRK